MNANNISIEEAILMLDKAERDGAGLLADELLILSEILREGFKDLAPDPQRADALLDRAARMDHPVALVMKAAKLANPDGSLTDPEALHCIRRAAEMGEAESMYNLAVEIMPDDTNRAMELFQMAADREYPAALFQMAVAYLKGMGNITPDHDYARFYELAALDGRHQLALQTINNFFEGSDCVTPENTISRLKVLENADKAGCAAASFALFSYLLEKAGEDSTDIKQPDIAILRRAAEGGYSPAMIALTDFDTPDDPQQLARMLDKPAREHYSSAMSTLGRMYLAGEGVEQNSRKGMELIVAALNFGDPDAMTFIADAAHNGSIPDPTGGARAAIYTELCRQRFSEAADSLPDDLFPDDDK